MKQFLSTQFNGNKAPGGVYDTLTHTYTKKSNNPVAGKRPHTNDLGGFDEPIIERLKSFDCKLIELVIPSGTYYISFADFLSQGYPVYWRNDARFSFPRYYCPAYYWSSSRKAVD